MIRRSFDAAEVAPYIGSRDAMGTLELLLRAFDDEGRDGVSVVIPLTGSIHRQRIAATVASLRSQVGPSVEIVVAHPSSEPSLYEPSSGVRCVPVEPFDHALPNVSRLRNVGAAASHGRVLFFCDADIVLADSCWLALACRRLAEYDVAALARPIRNRILEHRQDELIARLLRGAPLNAVIEPVDDAVYRYRGASADVDGLVWRRHGDIRRFARERELEACTSDVVRESLWRASVWGGGLLVRRACFDAVAGYSEHYRGWGTEDADLLDKLARVFELVELYTSPDAERFAAFHLEHESLQRFPTALEASRALRQRRASLPLCQLVVEDVEVGHPLYYADLAERHPWVARGPSVG